MSRTLDAGGLGVNVIASSDRRFGNNTAEAQVKFENELANIKPLLASLKFNGKVFYG